MIRDNSKILNEYGYKWTRAKKIYVKLFSGNFLGDHKKYFKIITTTTINQKFFKNKFFFYNNHINDFNYEKNYKIFFDYINSLILKHLKDLMRL